MTRTLATDIRFLASAHRHHISKPFVAEEVRAFVNDPEITEDMYGFFDGKVYVKDSSITDAQSAAADIKDYAGNTDPVYGIRETGFDYTSFEQAELAWAKGDRMLQKLNTTIKVEGRVLKNLDDGVDHGFPNLLGWEETSAVAGPGFFEQWQSLPDNAGKDWDDLIAELEGAQGDDGASAYETWIAAGNVGTEDDFLDSLKGTGVPSITEQTAPVFSATVGDTAAESWTKGTYSTTEPGRTVTKSVAAFYVNDILLNSATALASGQLVEVIVNVFLDNQLSKPFFYGPYPVGAVLTDLVFGADTPTSTTVAAPAGATDDVVAGLTISGGNLSRTGVVTPGIVVIGGVAIEVVADATSVSTLAQANTWQAGTVADKTLIYHGTIRDLELTASVPDGGYTLRAATPEARLVDLTFTGADVGTEAATQLRFEGGTVHHDAFPAQRTSPLLVARGNVKVKGRGTTFSGVYQGGAPLRFNDGAGGLIYLPEFNFNVYNLTAANAVPSVQAIEFVDVVNWDNLGGGRNGDFARVRAFGTTAARMRWSDHASLASGALGKDWVSIPAGTSGVGVTMRRAKADGPPPGVEVEGVGASSDVRLFAEIGLLEYLCRSAIYGWSGLTKIEEVDLDGCTLDSLGDGLKDISADVYRLYRTLYVGIYHDANSFYMPEDGRTWWLVGNEARDSCIASSSEYYTSTPGSSQAGGAHADWNQTQGVGITTRRGNYVIAGNVATGITKPQWNFLSTVSGAGRWGALLVLADLVTRVSNHSVTSPAAERFLMDYSTVARAAGDGGPTINVSQYPGAEGGFRHIARSVLYKTPTGPTLSDVAVIGNETNGAAWFPQAWADPVPDSVADALAKWTPEAATPAEGKGATVGRTAILDLTADRVEDAILWDQVALPDLFPDVAGQAASTTIWLPTVVNPFPVPLDVTVGEGRTAQVDVYNGTFAAASNQTGTVTIPPFGKMRSQVETLAAAGGIKTVTHTIRGRVFSTQVETTLGARTYARTYWDTAAHLDRFNTSQAGAITSVDQFTMAALVDWNQHSKDLYRSDNARGLALRGHFTGAFDHWADFPGGGDTVFQSGSRKSGTIYRMMLWAWDGRAGSLRHKLFLDNEDRSGALKLYEGSIPLNANVASKIFQDSGEQWCELFYLDNEYLDITDLAVRQKFHSALIDGAGPALGCHGPTGRQPILAVRGNAAEIAANPQRGRDVGWSLVGTVTDAL